MQRECLGIRDLSSARGFTSGSDHPEFAPQDAEESGIWWIKLAIDTDHPLAWRVVQELGHVLNYISPSERLPTVFMPVSPPPYMNGGPRDFLSWVIECHDGGFGPRELAAERLEFHLPSPVEDEGQWRVDV